tara:strand:+ start:104 stop:691 length:588 start_codon:yes stop_codon:yes gene_type:complete
MFKKGCLFISIAFVALVGGCNIWWRYQWRECLKPQETTYPIGEQLSWYINTTFFMPKEFVILDSYDSGRTCSFLPDGETNGVFELSEENLNIQEIIQIDELQWMQGPIDKKFKGSGHLYSVAFLSWDRHFKDHRRPKLPKSIPFLSRKKLFESRSFYHLGSCQQSKEDELLPCRDGFLMIYDPEIQLLYVSQFNS